VRAAATAALPEHDADAPAASNVQPPDDNIASFMAEHFVIATLARDAVIKGKVNELREPLRALADYRYTEVALGGWADQVAQLQQAARLTSEAKTIEQAATGVAAMARVCGSCHLRGGRGPAPVESPRETKSTRADDLAKRMYRHMWAADRMWIGLTTPSDDAWLAGASALARAPQRTPVDAPVPPPGFGRALLEVRQLGQRAGEVSSLDERANVYALLLATCANCHAFGADAEF
jgi:cytochrome c553